MCDQELIVTLSYYLQRAISLSLVSPSKHSELVEIVKKVSDCSIDFSGVRVLRKK